MHARVSVNTMCFPGASLAQDIEHFRILGARRAGILGATLAAGEARQADIDLLRHSGLMVSTLSHLFLHPHRLDQPEHWDEARQALSRTIATAREIGAETIYITTGGRGALGWEEAARAFCEVIAPCREEAVAAGIPLLIEPTTVLHAEISIVHTLKDSLRLAELSQLGVCFDVFPCWTEPGLKETILRGIPHFGLVQVADYVLGDRKLPCRAVPGDGNIPLRRILDWILEGGYQGAIDLELMGPRIDKEGHIAAAGRAAQWLEAVLTEAVG